MAVVLTASAATSYALLAHALDLIQRQNVHCEEMRRLSMNDCKQLEGGLR